MAGWMAGVERERRLVIIEFFIDRAPRAMDDLINQLAPFRPIADRVRPIMPAPIVHRLHLLYTQMHRE